MSKALKALKSIRERVNTNDYGFYDHDAKSDAECDVIEKTLKALEIVKKKSIWPIFISADVGLEYYNENYDVKLTQDEYNLLKEVLWED